MFGINLAIGINTDVCDMGALIPSQAEDYAVDDTGLDLYFVDDAGLIPYSWRD